MDRDRTDFFTVVCSGKYDITDSRCGQNAVCVGTVFNGVSNIYRNFSRMTGCAYTGNIDCDRRTGSSIFRFNFIGNMVKCFGSNCRGNNKEAIGYRAFRTVGGFVDDFERIFAFRLAAIGHGAAAVKVSCPFAAEVNHNLCLFHERQTCGYRFLVTVSGKEDNLVIFRNTDCLTRIFLSIVLVCIRKHDFSVKHEHLVDAECFLNIALIGCIVICIANLYRAVFENRKICRLLTTRNIVAVHDKYAGGFTCRHVVVGCIDTRYYRTMVINIAGSRFLIKSRHLFGELGHAV